MLDSTMASLAEIIFALTIITSSVHFMAQMTAAQIISKWYSHIISAAILTQGSVIALIIPGVVSFVAPHHAAEEWAIVFYFVAGILVVSNILFLSLTRIRPAAWAQHEAISKENDTGKILTM
ncbi:hypothetical protein L596_029149 [Steinernema carpocapsae]|uniref:Major facilitator superfamily (MFS) profile domain-containing protein n=1 Tax=Steinernema carpocapsae TaxID=34508 RepID=A0A4U5LTS6_STECR|nr:hypothetical protein L596_029149 [Steinernema carpocapsae]